MKLVGGKWRRRYKIRGSLAEYDGEETGAPKTVLAQSIEEVRNKVKVYTGKTDWLEIEAPSGEVVRIEVEKGDLKVVRDDFAKRKVAEHG